jgi:prolipoprotein diacylglyceryltransferase
VDSSFDLLWHLCIECYIAQKRKNRVSNIFNCGEPIFGRILVVCHLFCSLVKGALMEYIHLWFDLIAYVVSVLVYRALFGKESLLPSGEQRWYYYTVVIIGFVTGAVTLSIFNAYLSLGIWAVGKSIIGALLGAIIAVEWYKHTQGIRGSTGAYFVPSLAIGIAVGRIGCFLSGLKDYTYGVETTLPWSVDFGDGVLRHPVQLYESGVMVLFFLVALWLYRYRRVWFESHIFYLFVVVYGLQRFGWEMLKPYATLGGLTVFGWVSLMLIAYGGYNLIKQRSTDGVLYKEI